MKFLDLIKEHLALPKIGGVLLSGFALTSFAQSNLDYTAVPPLSQQFSNDPMVMLALASDHQLFIRAYNEYDDLDGDEQPDSGYSHNFAYVGYFDNQKCYSYAGGIFSPTATAPFAPADVPVPTPPEESIVPPSAVGSEVPQYCPGNEWSGNFLNWLTMTRADIVRLVLYGGYRSTDTATETVLERAYLPSDAHSFAKYYAGGDINNLVGSGDLAGVPNCSGDTDICRGVTFCNTSRPANGNHLSHVQPSATQPPLLRVVKGNYSLWGSSERYQCLTMRNDGVFDKGPEAGSGGELQTNGVNTQGKNVDEPWEQVLGQSIHHLSPRANQVKDFNVRVQVCGANSENGSHKCRAYGTSRKPIGVLQEVGEEGTIKFGLMTKGYNTNKSFGALRKNISSFADEINDDGTFKVPPVGELYGSSQDVPESIVGALNALRLIDYRYNYDEYQNIQNGIQHAWRNNYFRGTYLRLTKADFDEGDWGPNDNHSPNRYNFADPSNANYDCTWGRSYFENGECRNWGNPFSELMAEAYRYLAGAPSASVTNSNLLDENLIPGLKVAPWNPPTRAPAPGTPTAADLSCVNMNVLAFNASAVSYDGDELANLETSDIQIGSSADSRSIADLTNFIGVQDGIRGGFYFVGATDAESSNDSPDDYQQCTAKEIINLADVRGTCPDAPRLEGSYLVAGLSHFVKTRDMLPHVAGKNTISTFGVKMAGDLPRIELGNGVTVIPACRNESDLGNCALVDFRKLESPSNLSTTDFYFVSWEDSEQGGDYDQDLNGVIGIKVDGNALTVTTRIYQVSTTKDMSFGYVISGVAVDNGMHKTSQVFGGGQPDSAFAEKRFNLSETPTVAAGQTLEDPLWYATKWGGFKDSNTQGNSIPIPDLDSEWKGVDDNPIGYTLVRNPADLGKRLSESIKGLVKRPASGSGAAVASNTLTGEGLLLQAAYKPEVTSGSDKVSWVGVLNGLFFDSYGNVREDTNSNQKLDAGDNIIQIYYDDSAKDTLVRRMPFNENIESIPAANITPGLSLESIKPVWSARDELADLTNEQKTNQRTFSESAGMGRYIFTSVDKGTAEAAPDGITTEDDVVDFNASMFDGTNTTAGLGVNNYRLLGVIQDEAGKVVDFIRGVEGIEGFRNRTVNYNGVSAKPWILGDIVHSTPAVVGRPSAGYNVSYSDQTYTAFRNQYLNRRQVAYVGANDGMLHAFNMGVYNEMTQTFDGSGHPLGGELWAYVPYNLLPHLKWLTQPSYEHVYYVDSSVKTYDVNIFPSTGESGAHPYGWGTILVAGMRFGGGEYSVTVDGEAAPRKLRSAYMIFDITNPEQAPKLIAEITDEDLGYTLMEPELVHFRQSKEAGGFLTGDTRKNGWHLVFGNGPADLANGISDNPAKLFYLDLEKARRGQVELEEDVVTTANGHVGGLRAVDWDGDFQDDYLYISVVGDGGTNLGGLYHARLASNNVIGTVNPLLDGVSAPFSVPVLPVRNLETGDFWVFAGTGRLLVSNDLENEEAGAYYGIKVSRNSGTNFETSVDIDDLYPVTGHSLYEKEIYGDTMVTDADGVQLGTLEEFQEEKIDRAGNKGWYKTFTRSGESNFVPTSLFRSALLINSYTPGISDCEPLGKSYLYALNAFNGLPDASLGNLVRSTTDTTNVGDDPYKKVEDVYGELDGVAMNVSFTDTDTGFIGTSPGVLKGQKYETKPTPGARRSWTEIPLDIVQ